MADPLNMKLIREPDKKWRINLIWDYVDNFVRIFFVAICADFIQRLYLAVREYVCNEMHYLPDQQLWTILRRAYTYKSSALILLLALLCTAFGRFGCSGRLPAPSVAMMAFMPLYWMYNAADVGNSALNYAYWIREQHGLDYASGMASNYFHGYLNLSLPARSGNEGLRKRIQIYENTFNVTFGIDRFIILIPDDLFVNGTIESDHLERAAPLETVHINRAGVNRPFKHGVYKLKQPINGTTYYFAMEGATPMLSFFEAMNHSLTSTWQMREMKREIWLKFSNHLKELINTSPGMRREVELLIYNSHKATGEPVDVGQLIQTHFQLKNNAMEP